MEGWSNFADILESSCAARHPTVCRGSLKGMICKDAAEAELIDKLADTSGVVDAAAHRKFISGVVVAAAHGGLVFLTQGENCRSIPVSDKDWIDVDPNVD